MKLLLLPTFLLTASAFATPIYIGLDYNFNTEIETKLSSGTMTEDADSGYNAKIGYELVSEKVISLGIEIEYRQFGDLSVNNGTIETHGYYFNLAPKYRFGQNLYLGAILGMGTLKLDKPVSGDGNSFQWGAELGYAINPMFTVLTGYRSVSSDIDHMNIEFKHTNLYAGGKFTF